MKGDGIVSCAADLLDAVVQLLDEIVDDEAELITVIIGEDADVATTDSVTGWLSDHHGAVEVEVHAAVSPSTRTSSASSENAQDPRWLRCPSFSMKKLDSWDVVVLLYPSFLGENRLR